jgi:hypothetical protein
MKVSAVQKLNTVEGQKVPIIPPRVIYLRPSIWERGRAWAERTLTEEKIAEPALIAAALFLWGWFFFCLYQALQNRTVLP